MKLYRQKPIVVEADPDLFYDRVVVRFGGDSVEEIDHADFEARFEPVLAQ